MNHALTWVQHPAYTEAEWISRNPYLFPGEEAHVLINGLVRKIKIGPGFFNDLAYQSIIYPYTGNVLGPIGDATGDLSGQSVEEILFKMLNPYQTPVLSNARNNAGGTYATDRIFEIGQSVASPVTVQVTCSNQSNLQGATPLNINSSGVFNNDGNFAFGPVSLTRSTPINPSIVSTITIRLKVTHQRGQTPEIITRIIHYPKILWGVSPNTLLAPGDWNSLTLRKTAITNNFERDFDFGTSGYSWLAIPSMLSPGTLIFTDVTDPNAPAGYGFQDMGTQTINNGVGTYSYQTYRSTFNILVPSILRLRKAT